MNEKVRLALVVSHPIQHFCPQYVSFSDNRSIEFKVFFASRLGLEKYHDINFDQEISWGNLQIDKFEHEFLNGDAILQSDKNIDAPGLENALKNFKPNILITYGYFQKLQRRAYRWAKKNSVSVAYISDSELRHRKNYLKEFIKYPYLRRYFFGIDYFLTVGEANEEFYRKYAVPKEKMLRMHFPIDIKLYEKSWLIKANLREGLRLKYGIRENEIVLSVVGKLVSWKSQDHIIRALIELEKEGKSFHLFIIGSGEMLHPWKALASKLVKSQIHFTGFVDTGELPAYYAATDIYVHPAFIEPHSIAVSEAIYMGCPVIISDTCGSYGEHDDVQENLNGLVFSFGNISELASSIKLLGENNHLRMEYGKYSHEIAQSFQQNAHQLILDKLVNKIA